jgi:hypothetical protein
MNCDRASWDGGVGRPFVTRSNVISPMRCYCDNQCLSPWITLGSAPVFPCSAPRPCRPGWLATPHLSPPSRGHWPSTPTRLQWILDSNRRLAQASLFGRRKGAIDFLHRQSQVQSTFCICMEVQFIRGQNLPHSSLGSPFQTAASIVQPNVARRRFASTSEIMARANKPRAGPAHGSQLATPACPPPAPRLSAASRAGQVQPKGSPAPAGSPSAPPQPSPRRGGQSLMQAGGPAKAGACPEMGAPAPSGPAAA